MTVAQVAKHLKRDRTRATRGLKEAADLGYLTNLETRAGRAARYASVPSSCPRTRPRCPQQCLTTRALAHPHSAHTYRRRSQTGVRLCAVCAEGAGDDTHVCTVCGEPLDQALIAAGFTTHGEETGQ